MRRWLPRSLYARLLGIAALSTLAALLFAGFAIGHVLERFVVRGLDERLDAQVAILARAVRPDGSLDAARVVALPGFGAKGSGWVWQVRAPDGRRWTSGDAAFAPAPPFAEPPRDRPGPPFDRNRPEPGEGRTRGGERLHTRTLRLELPAGSVTVMAGGPRRIVDRPLREALVPLLGSLALLGAGLGIATLLQLRIGLRPLRTLAEALADVRAGRRRDVPADQPTELLPLARELNALIEQNEAGLAHARQHVANLAHGLKTPLAALAVRLAEPGRDPDGSLGEMVRRIDGRVRHHLGRARAAAPGGGGRVRTAVAPAVADLVAVLARINADRAVTAVVEMVDDLAVAVERQDLDEMLGNLLDNGWRHAAARLRVTASGDGATVTIAIADDGKGLDDAAIAEALVPGRRLDERGDGHGFGLSIARELAELNGGTLTLGTAPDLGGLRATVMLPSR